MLRHCMQPVLDGPVARIEVRGSCIMLQSELLGLLEKTADAAFCVNEQGDICSWNTAAEKLFGYSPAEAIGESCHRLLRGRGNLGTQVCTPEFYAGQPVEDDGTMP